MVLLGVEGEEEVAEFLDELFEAGGGELGLDGFEGGDEELCDLVGGVRVGGPGVVVVGESAFEEPAGGAPIAVVSGGSADSADHFDFDVGFGLGELGGELGIACGGSGDGGGAAADAPGGEPAAATASDELDDALKHGGVERRASAAELGLVGGWTGGVVPVGGFGVLHG